MHVFLLCSQTKYTLIDEQDIPLVENYAFEVRFTEVYTLLKAQTWSNFILAYIEVILTHAFFKVKMDLHHGLTWSWK